MQRTALILLTTPCAALVDSRWLVTLKIGRVNDADSLGPPLAMFSPGGGRASAVAPWGSEHTFVEPPTHHPYSSYR